MDVGQLFFGFNGRINRARYWIATLVFMAISVALAAIGYAIGDGVTFQALNGMLSIVMIISGLAVGIKRLHDRNKSGWYMLLFYVLPFVLVLLGLMFDVTGDGSSTATLVLGILALAVMLWAFVELGCLRGTIGTNAYGPDPIAPDVLTPPVRIPR